MTHSYIVILMWCSFSPLHTRPALEHQHTHNAPHAHPHSVRTEDALAAINAPDFVAVGKENIVQGVGITTVSAVSLSDGKEEEDGEERWQILMGISLLLGFLFMLFVDQVGGGHSHAPSSGIYIVYIHECCQAKC